MKLCGIKPYKCMQLRCILKQTDLKQSNYSLKNMFYYYIKNFCHVISFTNENIVLNHRKLCKILE